MLLGKVIEGVWHTGIVVYGKEYYFGGGISYDPPGMTPFGKFKYTHHIYFRLTFEDTWLRIYRVARGYVYGVFKRD